jgi:hypothetical protein
MSEQPSIPTSIVNPAKPEIPMFEGRTVDATHIKISGTTEVVGEESLVVSVDDRVHLSGDYKVVGVRHYVDKDGKLIREHVLKPDAAMVTPWDTNDPADDGVVRALRVV